ncbi:MAG: hypothetical protein A3F91_00010 [Flavobacteria bacterium RIFCSPLOWO2_12_FULL_35_11]|nr:MAG: hypothetical protein A3F91_00010 [Flavobacteria bacterium RIFCSPLOWO2_12_FULL_35_11]
MIVKRFSYFFFIGFIVSCNSTSSFTEINPAIFDNKSSSSTFIIQRMDFIETYISKIDFKANDSDKLNTNELDVQGDKRIITTNESEKNIVLRNNSIVRVWYKDHLVNNFIKSKVFYYENDKLICIKLYEILPNEFNIATLYKRTIYFHNDLPISDSDAFNQTNNTQTLAFLGREYLKNEYLSLK